MSSGCFRCLLAVHVWLESMLRSMTNHGFREALGPQGVEFLRSRATALPQCGKQLHPNRRRPGKRTDGMQNAEAKLWKTLVRQNAKTQGSNNSTWQIPKSLHGNPKSELFDSDLSSIWVPWVPHSKPTFSTILAPSSCSIIARNMAC